MLSDNPATQCIRYHTFEILMRAFSSVHGDRVIWICVMQKVILFITMKYKWKHPFKQITFNFTFTDQGTNYYCCSSKETRTLCNRALLLQPQCNWALLLQPQCNRALLLQPQCNRALLLQPQCNRALLLIFIDFQLTSIKIWFHSIFSNSI